MKYLLILPYLLFAFQSNSQKFFVNPIVGLKTEIGSTRQIENSENAYYQVFTPRMHFGLSPITLGLNFEFQHKKSLYCLGIVHGDQANSTVRFEYFVKSEDPYSGYKFKTFKENYAGYNVFKIPLSYKRQLFTLQNNKKQSLLDVQLHTGLNLEFLKIKQVPVLQNPISFGQEITLLGDTIESVGYSGHNNRSFSMSFNLGLDFDFYLNNKRRFNLQLYYEQGTYKIAQSVIGIYYNGETNISKTGYSAYSRGSSIHLKLGFPISLTK